MAIIHKVKGGGGSSVTVESLNVTENGTYTADIGKAYSPVVVDVPSGGGGSSVPEKDVNFYDYDGTCLYSYTAQEFGQLSALPSNPSHDGLVAQGWNWTLADAKTYVAECGALNIGQNYKTISEKTEIDVELGDTNLDCCIVLRLSANVTVEWGDGASETISGYSYATKYPTHTYQTSGKYTITITLNNTGNYKLYGGNNNSFFKHKDSNDLGVNNGFSICVKAIRLGQDCSLGQKALRICRQLRYITIPLIRNVFMVEASAMEYCDNLVGIVFPDGLSSLGGYTLQQCQHLRNVCLPKSLDTGSSGGYHFYSCFSLDKLTFGPLTTVIRSYCFGEDCMLRKITLPSSLTEIQGSAFAYTYNLGELHMKSTTPPTLAASSLTNVSPALKIYVPQASLETYKTASNWSSYASQMVGE